LFGRYLIIIYDIWDVHAWAVLKCAFPENDLGSRIITTTRIQEVARACCFHQHGHILEMKPLSNEDSRRLFYNRIFGSQVACPHHLEDVSVEILEKCGGLPLAIIIFFAGEKEILLSIHSITISLNRLSDF
jgi:disease resistance protein RPM1